MTTMDEAKTEEVHVLEVPQKRDRRQINVRILVLCLPGAKKTHIVYQANINFKVLKIYLHRLVEAELLKEDKDLYYTTDAGKRYIYHAEKLSI